MDTLWSQIQTHGIDVEEIEFTEDEFENLFNYEMIECPAGD
jgi:hypothetical protein